MWSKRAGDGEGCCQTVTADCDSSFLWFYFLCPPLGPRPSAPQSPDDNSSVQPGRDVHGRGRQRGCRDNELKAPQARVSGPARHIVCCESESSQRDPVAARSIVDQSATAEVIGLGCYRSSVSGLHCAIPQKRTV